MQAWIVGQNETAILGEGWYDRAPDWFGLPFRESFPHSVLRIPSPPSARRVTLLLSSALAFHTGSQWVEISLGGDCTRCQIHGPRAGLEWQVVTVPVPSSCQTQSCLELRLRSQPWRHGEVENIKDFREVGILFAGVLM